MASGLLFRSPVAYQKTVNMLTTTTVDHAIKVIVNVIYLQLASGTQAQRDVQNPERLRLSDRVGVAVSSRRALCRPGKPACYGDDDTIATAARASWSLSVGPICIVVSLFVDVSTSWLRGLVAIDQGAREVDSYHKKAHHIAGITRNSPPADVC